MITSISSLTASNWVGTYTIVGDTICNTDSTYWIASELELELSEVAETFEYEDKAFSINGCVATDGLFTFTTDGDDLTVELNTTGCIWEFTK